MKHKIIIAFLAVLTSITGTAAAQESPAKPDGRMDWFRQARFGMFVHWGVYAVPAGEWNGRTDLAEWFQLQANMPKADYAKFADQFDPEKFDAKAWVKTAKDAGMKYMVVTAKHHDGFCMWPTKLSDWSICRSPWWEKTHRDPLQELAGACKEAGLMFCLYYSLPDWNHPDFPAKYSQTKMKGNPNAFHGDPKPDADLEKYVAYMKGQLRELLTDYGPIGIIWFDGGGSFRGRGVDRTALLHAKEVVDLIHELQPDCLVNNRLDEKLGDYGTPEQSIPSEKQTTAFEVCMTLNRHWGFNKADDKWKPAAEVIEKELDIASKGGNFLLNVGPTASGEFPAEANQILSEVGAWLKVNGEAVFGTCASPFGKLDWGRCTVKNGDAGSFIYLNVLKWPADGKLTLPGIESKVTEASLLANGERVEFSQSANGVTFKLPREAPDKVATVIRLKIPDPTVKLVAAR